MNKPLNILIIEDNIDDAYLIEKTLVRAGLNYKSTVISEKIDFISEVSTVTYDVILTDNSMAQFDSNDVMQFLKQKNIKSPVIIVSGSVTVDSGERMKKEGVFDYINKDNLKELAGIITKAIAH